MFEAAERGPRNQVTDTEESRPFLTCPWVMITWGKLKAEMFALACISQDVIIKALLSLIFQVKVGDTLDLLIGEDKETETVVVMRILLTKVFEEKTESEKFRVVLRRWKKLKLPKKSVTK